MLEEYTRKYLFVSNVRIGDSVASSMLGYDTEREAEIKYHDEVSYGLKNADIVLAHYMVMNEYGVISGGLEKIIDNQQTEPEEVTE
jgi:hypothetical protein